MRIGARTRRGLMWAAWSVLCIAMAMWVGLRVGRPLYYSDGAREVLGADAPGAGLLRWPAPAARQELPFAITGRVARLPDGRLLFGVLGEDGTSDLVTWHPERPDVPPEPAYGLNTQHNELAPAVSADGRVWFASDRPGGVGGYDLWVARATGRGFAGVEPVPACNTALDETDPAPDPEVSSLVFVRIDRGVAGGDDGALWRWRVGDALDPVRVYDDVGLRRRRVVDRDPVFAADGASLWFVRKELGVPLAVQRASRLGERFDVPVAWSGGWGTPDLRSPVPSADGRELWLLQPPQDGAPSLAYVTTAEELVPWWPGQRWLEWLLLSAAACALALLLLLWLGQRWTALDLVAQCLLLSLLLHVLLYLWLMGVEIAGALLPGRDDDDGGMQVHLVASASTGESGGASGDVAATARFTPTERSLDVAAPAAAALQREAMAASLSVDHGSYEAAPAARGDRGAEAELADEAVPMATRDGVDASRVLQPTQLPAVEANAAAAATGTARAAAAVDAGDVVVVATPSSGVVREAPGAVALAASEPAIAIPLRAAPARSAAVTGPELQDAPEAVAAAAPSPSSSPAERTGPAPAMGPVATPAQPAAAQLSTPERGTSPGGSTAVADAGSPGSAIARAATPIPVANGAGRMAGPPRPSARPSPRVALAGAALQVAAADPGPSESSPSVPRPAVATSAVALPEAPLAAATNGVQRQPPAGAAATDREVVAAPGSALAREAPGIEARPGSALAARPMPRAARAAPGGLAMLREPGAAPERSRAQPAARAPAAAPLAAALPALPAQPSGSGWTAARRLDPARGADVGVFADRLAVRPPATRVLRATATPTTAPMPQAPAVARNAYSNRFGPAKAEALERFGGSDETERAVRDGLRYLARIQNANGSWGDNRDFDAKYGFVYVGKTALCLLAFLGAGHSPTSDTEHSAVVGRALTHLLSLQDRETGAFGRSSCYGHGIATYALAECYGLSKDPALLRPLEAALTWILANQGPRRDRRNRGGWGYFSPGLRAEDSFARVSVSSWMIMALESARLSGIELPDDALPLAREYLELSYDRPNGWFRYNHEPSRLRSGWPTLPASTPAAAFCLMLLGKEADDAMVQAAVDFTVERRPQRYRRYSDDQFVLQGQGNVYFWYYGSLCCFLAGGEAWQQWNARLSTVLPAAQAEDGSFPPIDVYAEEAGDTAADRSYTTAMCVLSLEVYYRYFTPLLLGR